MLDKLEQLVGEIGALHNKLIVLTGPPGAGKSTLLAKLADLHDAQVMNVGLVLAKRLTPLAQRLRSLQAVNILRQEAEGYVVGDLLLLDNIELLFDQSLRLDPLDLLRRQAHSRRVIAVWPGELCDGRLSYAEIGHAEHQDYGLEGLVPFELQTV